MATALWRCDTDLYEFEADSTHVRTSGQTRFSGSECFSAATVDLTEKRVLLSLDSEEGPELWAADLTERPPTPRELLELPGADVPTVLDFDPSRRILFAALGESGDVWQIDLGAEEPSSTRIDHDFGWPMAAPTHTPTTGSTSPTPSSAGSGLWTAETAADNRRSSSSRTRSSTPPSGLTAPCGSET